MHKGQKIKAILFDLDGVLVDTYKVWFRLFNKTLKHFGYQPITLKVFAENWGQSTQEDVRIFMPEIKLKDVKRYLSINFPKFMKYMKVNPEAIEVLKKLKKMGLKIGCVTNSHCDITKLEIEKSGLKKFFDVVITADDVKKPKPAPDMLVKAIKNLKGKSDNVIFVGDTKTDLIAGENAGCIVVGYNIKNRVKISSLKQIFTILKNFETKE